MTNLWPRRDAWFMNNTPDVIVLCGGAGLRLRSITGAAPKTMASIGGRPFLELLLKKLERSGFRRVILAIGYQGQVIRSFFGNSIGGLDLEYSEELTPLGTGGALRLAAARVASDAALITNGDSYTDADLRRFTAHYRQAGSEISVIVTPVDGRDDCGSVMMNGGRITSFREKTGNDGSHFMNAGIYMLSRRILEDIPEDVQVSLEQELFPRWLEQGIRFDGFVHNGRCVDIGTPGRYHSAQELLAAAEMAEDLSGSRVQQ
jgi:NDP-sugar pyrophosphorylase family protein